MYIFLTLATLVVVITITLGVVKFYKNSGSEKKEIKRALRINIYSIIPVMIGLIITAIPQVANAATTGDSASGLGYIAAALSTGLATIGSGYAVGAVGSSALGAISEDSKLLGKTLIYVGLAEGIAIYGLIISIMILTRL
ncbi:MAG: ATPase [Clostridiales bacterium]|jgi:V/A-type H+-transporting ATPase subunit K|nr:ATPase [Clostridiales bacterium]